MGPRVMRMGSGEDSTMRNFIVWAGHVARMEEGRSVLKILTGNLQERDLWGALGVDGRTILEWTLKR